MKETKKQKLERLNDEWNKLQTQIDILERQQSDIAAEIRKLSPLPKKGGVLIGALNPTAMIASGMATLLLGSFLRGSLKEKDTRTRKAKK